ncbi:MAG: hypothetical protein ACOCXT_00510 [Candidatus Dojkabacteria bacterium]
MVRQVNEILEDALNACEICHFTLDTDPEEIIARVKDRVDQKSPEWLREHVKYMRSFYDDSWTIRIDNTHLSAEDTLLRIRKYVEEGKGRLSQMLHDEQRDGTSR